MKTEARSHTPGTSVLIYSSIETTSGTAAGTTATVGGRHRVRLMVIHCHCPKVCSGDVGVTTFVSF